MTLARQFRLSPWQLPALGGYDYSALNVAQQMCDRPPFLNLVLTPMAFLQSPIEWNELRLVQSLASPYREALRRVYDYVAPLLGTRPLGAEELTDHDVHHSTRVLARAAQIMPASTTLNQPEAYILCIAALLHDAGLWTSKADTLALLNDQQFQEFVAKNWSTSELQKVQDLLEHGRLRWMGELSLSRLVAWYHRGFHAERLLTRVLAPGRDLGQSLRVLIGSEFVDAVAAVSVAHSWTTDQVLQDESLADQQFGDEVTSLRFLAALLRLGDLLDLGEGRISALLWEYLSPLSAESEAHWRKEATLKLQLCQPDVIRIVGRYDVDRFGMMAAEAHRLAQDWISFLQKEIEGVALVLNSRLEPRHRHRLQFGAMKLFTEDVTINGPVLSEKISFHLDSKRIFQILGEEIYGDRSIFIRELLQNAVDATRAQMIRDKRLGLFGANPNLDESAPWDWPSAVTNDERYSIRVATSPGTGDEEHYVYFSITDQGIGMTLADIRDYFLQVGKSFYKTSRYRQEFVHPSVSQFGIGFLSCLAVADRIEVTTRARSESAGARLILQQPSEHFIFESEVHAEPGTTVCLRISRQQMEQMDLPTFPLRSLHFFTDPEKFCDFLSIVVSQWAAYLEFPIIASGTLIERRDPRTFVPPYVFDGTSRESLPVTIISESGRELACGRVFYEVYEKTRLPCLYSVSPQTRAVLSFRGVGINDGRIDFTNHQVVVALDFRRLPQGAITAGRKLNVGWMFFSTIGDMVCGRLRTLTINELENLDPCVSVLWNHLLDRRMGTHERSNVKVPVRDHTGLSWRKWEDVDAATPRLLLVPFHVAWKGPWHHSIPAVGLTNEAVAALEPSRKRGNANNCSVGDCVLIQIEDTCTALLWPPGADVTDLVPMQHDHAHTHAGLVKWPNSVGPHCLRDAVHIDARLVPDIELPEYDQRSDPWWERGLHQYSRVNEPTILGEAARELFESAAAWSLEGHEIVVQVTDAEDWD